jgi:transglutaminase-like putative cysteine protease
MFEVAEHRPALLRVTSLDRFDGLRFLRSDSPPGSPALDLGRAPGEDRWYERATFTVGALSSSLLVSGAGTPVQARWLSAGAQSMHRESDGTTVFATTPTQGNRYEVSSYAPTPTAAALRRAPPRFPRAYLPYAQFELPNASASALRPADLRAEERARPSPASLVGASAPGRTPASDPAIARRIETSPYGPMFALARRLALGARTGYDVAERIERFLLAGYAYGENVPRRRYPLEAFLFGDARGYCQQFSGAMTLMLRMDGIPARVAAGFAPGIYNPRTARWRVRALDAHSWVEVYFSEIGWVPFDPTPPRPAPSSLAAGGGLVSSANGTHGGGRGLHGGVHGSGPAALGSARPGPRGPGGASSWLLAAIGLAALLALLAACWWIAGARRLRRALAGDASGAVAELRWALARVGQPIPPATTLAQLEARLSLARGGPASGYLRLLRELRYRADGAPGPSPRQRGGLRRALGGQGPLARVRALLALPPGATRRRSSPSP